MPMQLQESRELGRNHDLHSRSIERVILAISTRLDVSMSNDQMAEIACFSPCHFNRLFHKVTGIPPIQFHYAMRIARAKELLIETNLGITDICFEVGYNSLGTFISRFNELVGLSPSAFRRLARRISGMRLADFPLPALELATAAPISGGITGSISRGAEANVIFTGLFRRAIPEGRPSGCALNFNDTKYSLAVPPDGLWHVLSVAVPPDSDAFRLLTLKGLARGRSGPIMVENGDWKGDSDIALSPSSPFDPPILAAIPVQIAALHVRNGLTLRTNVIKAKLPPQEAVA
jgi:AraC family transcriptional regulator